jgi:hypothetical protein
MCARSLTRRAVLNLARGTATKGRHSRSEWINTCIMVKGKAMTKSVNFASNRAAAAGVLHESQLATVNGGVTGNDGGCIPPWIDPATGKIVFRQPVGVPNPWIGH